MTTAEKFWNRFAKGYKTKVNYDNPISSKIITLFRSYAKPDSVILDYGCATGLYTKEFALSVKTAYGIDISPLMIEKPRESCPENTKFYQTSIFDTEHLNPGKFQLIFASSVLHVVPEPKLVMQRIKELLTPNGILISITPSMSNPGIVNFIFYLLRKIRLLPYISLLKESTLEQYLTDEFKILEKKEISKDQIAIVSKKI